jgi:hypothetical protein
VRTQAQRVGVAHMLDPALHAGVEFSKADAAFAPVVVVVDDNYLGRSTTTILTG